MLLIISSLTLIFIMLPKTLIHRNSLEIYLTQQIRILRDKYTDEVLQEITDRKLLEFKGYINTKSIFKTQFNKLTNFFKTKRTQNEVKKFAKFFMNKGIDMFEVQLGENLDGVTFDSSKIVNGQVAKDTGNYVYELITGLNERMTNNVRSEVSRGVINGESMSSIIKRINKVAGKELTNAKTIARTESARIIGEGQYQAAQESSIKLRKYVSVTLDDRTSKICKRLHAKYGTIEQSIPLNQKFKTVDGEWQTMPAHPNCRSSTMFISNKEYNEIVEA